MSVRILFHVQHLLGTGHLRRAAAIGQALAAAGFEVTLASGGAPIRELDLGGARLVQLPELRTADVAFKTLLDERGSVIDAAWRAARRDRLLALFGHLRPHVLITELYPFGRRMLEFELGPLVAAARAAQPRPLILCSVRDILSPASTAAKAQATIARVTADYDHVLVHGDPAVLPLEASFPQAAAIRDRLSYTGYVQGPPGETPPPADGAGEVIVSVGGGAVGARLLATAIAARPLSRERDRRWRLLGGSTLPDDLVALARGAGPDLILEPARRDFPGLLARCHVSVSQCGYNTMMDILMARARSVVVPFAQANETEQAVRAAAMARRGWTQVVAESELTPVTLAAAVDRAALSSAPDAGAVRRDGAAATARLVTQWIDAA